VNLKLYGIFLFAIFSIIISSPQVFADTYFVSVTPNSVNPGCEENFSCYLPYQTMISIGDSVIWENDDSAAHTVTSGSPSFGTSDIFDSSLFMSGESFRVEFSEAGTFDYFCMVHPWMVGTVLVSSTSSESSKNISSGITPRGTPIPLDLKPKSVSGFTNYYNDEWGFSIDVPINWDIQKSVLLDEGYQQIVLFTPDPDYFSTFLAIDYYFDDYSYQGLYGNNLLLQVENNVKDWCDSRTLNEFGWTCNDFEFIQSDILDDQYIVSYTFTERGNNGINFDKMAVFSIIPLSDSEYIAIDMEIDFDNLELHTQQIGYMLTSTDFSILQNTSSPGTVVQPDNDFPVDLNFKKYTNNEFDFSINYPSGWLIDDELLVDGDFYSIVGFSSDDSFLQTMDVSIMFDDFEFNRISSFQYVSELEEYEKDVCRNSSYDNEGYQCSDFVVSDELSGSFTDDSGNRWHVLYYTYTENYPDQAYEVALAQFNLPVDDDTVIVYFYFDLDSYEDYLGNSDATQLVDDVMSSFKFISSTPSPTQVPDTIPDPIPTTQLECGSGTHEENGKCVVNSSGGGCLIATATYGSEMSLQVQLLREIRDNSLLTTQSGTNFINSFNDVYYSFSPYIADYERENPLFKEAVKVVITPMISSLSILNYVEMDSEESVLGYGISLIILNGLMYVGIPIIAFVGIRKRIR